MRREDRKMREDETLDILRKGEYGILSTVNGDNIPYGVPLSYVYDETAVYFHGAPMGTKLDNILCNPNVCFTVVGKTEVLPDKFSTEYESVIVFGKAIIIEGEDKVQPLKDFVKKYSPNFVDEGDIYINKAIEHTKIIKLEIASITGKHRI